MKLVRNFTLVVAALAAAPFAFAQDAPPPAPPAPPTAPPAPKEGEKPAAEKKERQVDAKAVETFERYGKMLAVPSRSGIKDMTWRMEMNAAMFGGTIVFTPHWNANGTYEVGVELPEQMAQMMPPEQVDAVKKQFKSQFADMAKGLIEDPAAETAEYNLAYSDQDGKAVVTMTPFTDKAKADSQKVTFGADGLLVKSVQVAKVDPNDPMAAAMAGAEVETTVRHEKKSAGYVVTGATILMPMGAAELAIKHYEIAGVAPLLKTATLTMDMLPEPLVIEFSDYVVDGKALDATKKGAAAAETAPTETPRETPKEDAPVAPPADK